MNTNSSNAGHWISIVVNKENNKLIFYSMDSLGGTPITMINALKNIIEKANIETAQINIEFEPEIDRVENILNRKNCEINIKLQDALIVLTKITDLALDKNLIDKNCFVSSKNRILQALGKIIQLDPTPNYKFSFEAVKLISKLEY